jgi:5-methylcytosine-specific restriction endonuclease McrA
MVRRLNGEARRRVRIRLGEAQNWRCCYCGIALDPDTLTIEHVIPLGVSNEWVNLAAACLPCNGHSRESWPKQRKRELALARLLAAEMLQERGIAVKYP